MSEAPHIITYLRAELGDYAEVQGRLAKVISINQGHREVTFEFVGSTACPTCGKFDRVSINEGVPNWEQQVRPVQTCGSAKLHLKAHLERLPDAYQARVAREDGHV